MEDKRATKRMKYDDQPEPAMALSKKSAVIEEQNGELEFWAVNNDGERESWIVLTGLKCIFQRQLPNMPKDYIARFVYDRTHISLAMIKKPLKVIGGVTFRPFEQRGFAEIVFFAISSDQQVQGHGAHLMAHFKDYVKATSHVMHFLTYADNDAIGFFKKQGFTKDISLDGPAWKGYIKDYDGGTIMQCTMVPRIRYLKLNDILRMQRACAHAKIEAFSRSHIIHAPPQQWENGVTEIDPLSIDAIRDSGWRPEMDEAARQPRRSPHYNRLLHLLNDMQNHRSSWPFLAPVSKDDFPNYYRIIREPMDLGTMETKLEADQYASPEDFMKDARLMFDNCRKYNRRKSSYTKLAEGLEEFMRAEIMQVPEWSHLYL
ncbi:Histone acetyltransferase GCN5-like protein [Pleurostoma richardsiae]|uniref:histone acetyltransferase n=1 Tax=Pleurostoma richardsiae TaxID=41990 RepID=A0AA38R7V1_9PEZI|nr:Histone acetyltransferase GCN5-like protein [Pleurostoma richardsiae]